MTTETVSLDERVRLLDELLAEPNALLVAIAADGHLVAMPASVPVPAGRVLQLPPDRATMLDVLVEDDAVPIVHAWVDHLRSGASSAVVHTRSDPLSPRQLSFLDVREQYGVCIGALGRALDDLPAGDGHTTITVSRRPRSCTVEATPMGVFTGIEERTTGMLGWTAEQMVGQSSLDFVHPDDQGRAIDTWMEMLALRSSQRTRMRYRRSDGSWVWVESECTFRAGETEDEDSVLSYLNDVSDEMAAQQALEQQAQLLRRVSESMPVGIGQLSVARELVYANTRLPAVLGLDRVDRLADVLGVLSEEDVAALDAALDAGTATGGSTRLEVRLDHEGEHPRVCSVIVTPLSDREGAPGALLCFTDETDSVRLREELTAKATFDVLTGCHNRASTMTALEKALLVDDGLTAVVFIDLDHFKPINDTLGHAVGDEVLAATATRLGAVLRADDVLGRIGGDEFLVIGRRIGSPDAALSLAQRLQDALVVPLELSAGTVTIGASIGVARAEPGVDAVDLTKRADAAMYQCKQQRLGAPVLYDGA
ncbi:diguanylate cyclase [Modestobacter sp. I12A-02628]|uniref:GGDEF domain-containing protein n=1 Tax=Goekera deserti TaxID=2497753 RepID=A0A7K3W9V7_9ACTN|nr:GGDEF domain-containing protein [Goekera deserti]MPQ98931.1 diguanylate cyclase [Goekera deserti]NDI49569.1 diguanylate cyclase [Goekera deserti]NEL53238.1 GGDEF domain-containing protein [Goekera deserti]